jgi:hypothetical protein
MSLNEVCPRRRFVINLYRSRLAIHVDQNDGFDAAPAQT